MPQIINHFIQRVLRFVKEFFQSDTFEYGIIDLTPSDNNRDIFVPASADVQRCWISLTPMFHPYLDSIPGGLCYVSEVTPVPGGFQFRVALTCDCRVSWFVIEK